MGVQRYTDRFKSGIVICLHCNHVEFFKKSKTSCPTCELDSLGQFENEEKFRKFVTQYGYENLHIHSESLQKIVNDIKQQERA